MSDFTAYGYQILEQLGRNTYGGRFTYKAINLNDRQPVVIKQFQFARDSNWEDYKAIEQEINTLKTLNHPGIPRYLAHFDPGDGICLVQEYKNARSLSLQVNYDPDRIQRIAISLLEILVYLQNLIPPVIHRDLKPENILVDDRLNVYLVDFGFSRMGEGSVALSSVAAGTFGFMPPEQLHNLQLSKASDLYSLGATLICLITKTKSTEIGKLMNLSNGRLQFQDWISGFTIEFSEWLEKMVEPDPDRRFPSAEIALKALLQPTRVNFPEVQISHSVVEFNATRVNERLIQTIWVKNSVPETILEGNWQVVADRKDPPHTPDSHAWISFAPKKFKSNLAECNVSIDTSKLKADSFYERWLLLQTNTTPNNYTIKLRVKTPSLPKQIGKLPYFFLFLPSIIAFTTTILLAIVVIFYSNVLVSVFQVSSISTVIGILIALFFFGIFGGSVILFCGALAGFLLDVLFYSTQEQKWHKYGTKIGTALGIIGGIFFGVVFFTYSFDLNPLTVLQIILLLLLISTLGIKTIISSSKKAVKELRINNVKKRDVVIFSGLMPVLGISLGVGLMFGLSNPLVILMLAGTALPVATMLFSYDIKRRKQIKERRQQKQYLIEP